MGSSAVVTDQTKTAERYIEQTVMTVPKCTRLQ